MNKPQALGKNLKKKGIGHLIGRKGFLEGRSTLVMIHGAGGNSVVWQTQVSLLDRVFNVVALDLPGHGESVGEGWDRLEGYSQWLGDLLRKCFPEPVILMGHSMGGAIVQEVAIEFPDLLKGIILAGTGPKLWVAPAILEGLLKDFEGTVDKIIGYAYSSKSQKRLIIEGAKLLKAAGSEIVYKDFNASNSFDRENDLSRVSSPCLILCGSEDKMTPPKLSQSLSEAIEKSDLKIIPGAGHMVMIERFEDVNREVEDFLRVI